MLLHRCCCSAGSEYDVSVTEVHNENLGTILVDKGMLEDHLPNHVLAALKLCLDKLLLNSPHYDPSKIQQLREKKEKLYRQVFRACKGEQTRETGFTFLVNETPMVSEQRRLSAGRVARQRTMETAAEQHQQPPSISLTVAADVYCEREVTNSSVGTNGPQDLELGLQNHAVELATPKGTAATQHRPKHLSLTVPTNSNFYPPTHSETLIDPSL